MKQAKDKKQSVKAKAVPSPSVGLYDSLNGFFERHRSLFFSAVMVLSALMCFLMFDPKMSLSGDDSDYVVAADSFWHHFIYPGGHGALYPMVIAPFVGIFGMNLILLKLLSAVFILLSIWLLYKSFCDKIPAVVLMPGLLLVSICSYIFFYACHTYSEPLFMLIQSLFIYFFSKYFLVEDVEYHLKADWRKYLIVACFTMLMTLTRSIGYGVVAVAMLYFVLQKRWKDLLYFTGAVVLVFGAFMAFKSVVWSGTGEAYGIQRLFSKDSYDINHGYEDIPGLFNRLKTNSLIYLSSFLYQFMGLQHYSPSNYVPINAFRAILMYVLFAVFIVILFRKNKTLLFTGLYAGIMNFFSFVLLQANWAQDRLIMIYYPFIIIFLLGGVWYVFRFEAIKRFVFVYPLIIIGLYVGTVINTSERVGSNLPSLQQNLLGDEFAGYTPDWENFIKASQWAAKNLEKDAVIVSRKPTMSQVYTGKEFTTLPMAESITIAYNDLVFPASDSVQWIVGDASKNVLICPYVKYSIGTTRGLDFNGKQITGTIIYELPVYLIDAFIEQLEDAKIEYDLDYRNFFEQNRPKSSEIRIYSPDMMVELLMDGGVDYLLLPQLRVDPTQNTGRYMNSVHRYKWFISYKYPNLFETVHTIGTTEPCEIVKFMREKIMPVN